MILFSIQFPHQVIRQVKPNVVVLELCKSRLFILEHDEKTMLEEAKNMGLAKIRKSISEVRKQLTTIENQLISASNHDYILVVSY